MNLSVREIGQVIRAYTRYLVPFRIQKDTTAIPAIDIVLLCSLMAVEIDKKMWRYIRETTPEFEINEVYILRKFKSLKHKQLAKELTELYFCNMQLVNEHLNPATCNF